MTAVALIVIDADACSREMPSNSVAMSSIESIAHANAADLAAPRAGDRSRSPFAWAGRRRRSAR